MTKQTITSEDDGAGALPSADVVAGHDAGVNLRSRGSNTSLEAVAAARRLAEAQRKLAESAGQMLYTLIQEGGAEVKSIIISAIIEKVQEPNTVPPDEVPELMTILRSAAEEQLAMVREGTDGQALASALEFGRWIKVPAGMLAEARNMFKAAQDGREKELQNQRRRAALGFVTANQELDAEAKKRSGSKASAQPTLEGATRTSSASPSAGGTGAQREKGRKLKGGVKKLKPTSSSSKTGTKVT